MDYPKNDIAFQTWDDLFAFVKKWLEENKIGNDDEKKKIITKQILAEIFECKLNINDIENIKKRINNNKIEFIDGNLWHYLENYFENERIIKFLKKVSKLVPSGLATSPNAACGKFELLYRLLRPNSRQPQKGDIIDNNERIEIKGDDIYIPSLDITGKQYNEITTNSFSCLGITGNHPFITSKKKDESRIVYEIEKKSNNSAYINQFQSIEKEKIIDVFTELLHKLKIENAELHSTSIFETGKYDQDKYIEILINDWFEKYKNQQKFDKIIFFGDGSNVKVVSDISDFKMKMIPKKNYVRINQHARIGWYVKPI